jgi:predicted dienelactone hydrolase
MSTRVRIVLCAISNLFFLGISAAQTTPSSAPPESFFSVPPSDAPELAARGPYAVGVRGISLTFTGRVDILKFDKTTGKASTGDRVLPVEIWYPATIPPGKEERTEYEMVMPGGPSQPEKKFLVPGKALRDAPIVDGEKFPLVIVSHGYPGSRFFLSYLTENLASKGYIVVAIDHTDSVLGAVRPFSSTLFNRSFDQLATIQAIEAGASHQPGDFLFGHVDESNVAIIGYSMGGYGALASAGAGYSKQSLATTTMVPGGYLETQTAGSNDHRASLRKEVKAVVAISPWGAQPPYNSWDAGGLAGIHIPLLMIAGDQDDVSDFVNGIKPAFEKIVNSDRCLLVYENARHNIGGNPPPPEDLGSFTTREYFDEPVWRKDRITAINQHFIAAFLDLHLKGDASRGSFLHVATEKSNDGTWPLKQGESAGAKYSDGGTYWKGFQRRWALGLEMTCHDAATKP